MDARFESGSLNLLLMLLNHYFRLIICPFFWIDFLSVLHSLTDGHSTSWSIRLFFRRFQTKNFWISSLTKWLWSHCVVICPFNISFHWPEYLRALTKLYWLFFSQILVLIEFFDPFLVFLFHLFDFVFFLLNFIGFVIFIFLHFLQFILSVIFYLVKSLFWLDWEIIFSKFIVLFFVELRLPYFRKLSFKFFFHKSLNFLIFPWNILIKSVPINSPGTIEIIKIVLITFDIIEIAVAQLPNIL